MIRRIPSVLLAAAIATGCADAEPTGMDPIVAPVFAVGSGSMSFHTHVTGAEETPPKDTKAQGQAIFRLSQDGSELHYRIIVADILNPIMSHIHLGPLGQAGPPVLWLYPSAPPLQPQLIPGQVQGVLGQGVATAADLVGSLAGQPLSALVEEIRAGNAYANVHTSLFPAGEIRGQID